MPKYRKRPVVVEALRFDGENVEEALEFVGEAARVATLESLPPVHSIGIETPDDEVWADPGDWIVKDGDAFSTHSPDEFEADYEAVED